MGTENFITTSSENSESVNTDTSTQDVESVPSENEGGNTETSEVAKNDQENQENSEESQGDQGQKDSEAQNKPKKKGGFERRIERFQRQMSEKDQRIAALEAQINGKTQTSQSESKSEGEPNPDDFDTVGEYARAVARWESKQAREHDRQEADRARNAENFQKRSHDYNSKVSDFATKTPDFHDVIEDFTEEHGQFQASPAIWEALHDSEFGAQIPYEVMKTPGEYERLSRMTEAQVIREIGKIEARLSAKAESAKQINKTSKAPAPASPIGKGSASTSKSINDPNISFSEYEKLRKQQMKK